MTRTIEDLPDLVMEQILSLLKPSFLSKRAQFVNKRWNGLIRGSSLWNLIKSVQLGNKNLRVHFILKVLEKCHNLEHLTIINVDYLKSLNCSTLREVCLPRLLSVVFRNNDSEMETLIIHIIKAAPLLQRIQFQGKLTQPMVDAISDRKELSSIDLILYNRGVDLTRLFQKCSKLEVVKFRADFNCHQINLVALFKYHFATLKSLSWMTPIKDAAVMLISKFTALVELGLDCEYLTDKSLSSIEMMSSLTCLILEYCRFFSVKALERFFEADSLPNLKRIGFVSLYLLDDLVLDAISHKYPNRETLEMEKWVPPSVEGFGHFPQKCGHIRILKLSQSALSSSLLISGNHPSYLPSLTYHELDMSILRNSKKRGRSRRK